MRSWMLLGVVLAGCQGVVGELGEYGPQALPVDPSAPRVLAFSCDASAVNAKVPITCLVQAQTPEGGAVSCTLDPGDGQPPVELGDCSLAQNTTVKFQNPGTANMVLTVIDAEGRTTVRTVTIDVTGPPNVQPVIDAFEADPPAGATPFTTTLTFAATDPDGDAITCALDVGDDGQDDSPALDCAAGTQAITVTPLGQVPVRLTVTDDRGGVTSQVLTLTVEEPRGDLRIQSVDWMQTVVKSDLKLVEGKAATLRVSVLADEPNLTASTEAEVKVNGTTVATLPFSGPAVVPQTEALTDLNRVYRVTIPAEHVKPGLSVVVRADSKAQVPETDETNNTRTVTPSVGRGNVVHLTAVPVVQSGLTGQVRDLNATVTQIWPVASVEAITRAPYTFSGTLTGGGTSAWSTLLSQLASVKSADGSQRNYYGFDKVNYGSGIAGIGYIGQHVATGRDDSLQTAAHELGHNFGRPHAPCGGVAGADPSYPYAGAKIGSWGWDGAAFKDPTRYVDLMSYCSPEWVSDYNYGQVQSYLEGRSVFAPGAALPYETTVLVSGKVTAGGKAVLDPVLRLRAHPTAPVDAPTVLRLTLDDGAVRLVPVELWEVEELAERHFHAIVAEPRQVLRVELVASGQVLGAAEASAAALVAPAVEVTRAGADAVRVRWNAQAFPTAAVAHFSDTERTTLALALEGGDALVRTDGLAGGRLEVSLSDGVASQRVELEAP